jgi:hypothetical protein
MINAINILIGTYFGLEKLIAGSLNSEMEKTVFALKVVLILDCAEKLGKLKCKRRNL